MESNGKSVTLDGQPVDLATGPVVWGTPGTNGQHAYYQLLHQGTRLVPADFIGFLHAAPPGGRPPRLAHGQFLRPDRGAGIWQDGRGGARAEGDCRGASSLTARFPGNRPTNTILAPELSPRVLGELVATYEHKVLTQGVIWGINSFDQWGVELGKSLALRIVPELTRKRSPCWTTTARPTPLIRRYRSGKASLMARRTVGAWLEAAKCRRALQQGLPGGGSGRSARRQRRYRAALGRLGQARFAAGTPAGRRVIEGAALAELAAQLGRPR